MMNSPGQRGQVGLGTLVIFVAMVIVGSVAAGVLISTIGFEAGGAEPPDADETGPPDRVLVIAGTGTVAGDGSVGSVNLTVTTGPGADDVDLRDVTLSWVGPNGAYNVAHRDAVGGSSDGVFDVTAVSDPSGSAPVLDGPADRMVLTMDLGETDDVPGLPSFGERLRPGDMVRVTLTTEDGRTTTTRLAVPRSSGRPGQVVL